MSRLFDITETYIKELFVIKHYSNITYDKKIFIDSGLTLDFIQENESYSTKDVLRGIHLQPNYPQGKLVKVLEGQIFDVAVDLRRNSKTFGKWYGIELSSDNNLMLYIPEGFGHGFFVKSDFAKIVFKVSNYWYPEDEVGIPWNDKFLDIDWKLESNIPIISEKDKKYIEIKENRLFKG